MQPTGMVCVYIYTWFNLGLGRSFFARVLGEPALFFLLRICCHTRPACKSLAGINDDRLQHMHACHARYTCSTRTGKKHGGSKFHLSFVRPFGPDFAPALPRALDLFLYFDIVFFYHLGSCRTCKIWTNHRWRSGTADALQTFRSYSACAKKAEK